MQECYSRQWLVTSMGLGPIAVALYLRCGPAVMVLAALIGAGAAAAAHLSTQDPQYAASPPDWSFGEWEWCFCRAWLQHRLESVRHQSAIRFV